MSAIPEKSAVVSGSSFDRTTFDSVLARIALVMQEKSVDYHPVCPICGRPITLLAATVPSVARGHCRCGYTNTLAGRCA